jgi:hypothetical protein
MYVAVGGPLYGVEQPLSSKPKTKVFLDRLFAKKCQKKNKHKKAARWEEELAPT